LLKVAVLIPDPANTYYKPMWREQYDRVSAPLLRHGVAVSPHPWTEPLPDVDLVLTLVTWGYHHRAADWFATVERWRAQGAPIANAGVLTWNADKAYLERLSEEGAPVIPSHAVEQLTPEEIDAARLRFGTDILVVKPRISAGAHKTLKLAPGDSLEGAPEGPALIQPYLPAVEREGELSLFFFDRRFSHAVAKVAAAGDFRVQPQFGGASELVTPDPEALAAAEAVLAKVTDTLTYARVDLIRGLDARWGLMELEVIEPNLFLELAPDGGEAYAQAVLRAVAELRASATARAS
jgi:glutathione synthase/RimK-type ligase-like ATP-grasp enzyme